MPCVWTGAVAGNGMKKLIAMLAMFVAGQVWAQVADKYPNKPIRMLVGFPPGGSTDILSRQVGMRLADSLGQQVVIDNRAGAAGNLASELVGKGNPDGYTLLMATVSSHGINPGLYKKLPYDPVKDYAPVTLIASYPLILAVNPGVPVKNVKDLIALAKSKPGAVRFGSSGNGSPGHLSGEIFKGMAAVDLVHVPYKGGAPSTLAVLSGEVQITFATLPGAMPHIKSGKLNGPAVTTAKRSPALPEVPTIAESGLPGFDVSSWAGLMAPVGTPKDIVHKLNTAAVKALASLEMRERLANEGAEPVGNTPEQFAAFVKVELAKWAQAIKQAGAQID